MPPSKSDIYAHQNIQSAVVLNVHSTVLHAMKPIFTLALLWIVSLPVNGQGQDFWRYNSPDNPDYKSYERSSQYVWMPDSVRLAVDVYIPTEGPERENFPVVLKMTPYGRAYIGPNVGFVFRTLAWMTGLGWRPLLDQERYSPSVSLLLKHGYAVVAADMRGTGASFGTQMPLDPRHGEDGKHLIDWIAGQSFSDGKVGMIGKSYMAWAQFATAAQQPEALKCIAPEVIFMESYTASYKPGGIVAERWMESFSERLKHMNLNYSDMRRFYVPSAPVVDEDGDGRIDDEWPLIDDRVFEDDTEPVYKDGEERESHLYWRATREHLGNLTVKDLMGDDFSYFDSKTTHPGFEGFTYRDVAPGYFLESVQQSGIPVFHIGRWFDGFLRGTTQLFSSSQEPGNHKMLITPGFHTSRLGKKHRKFAGMDEKLSDVLPLFHLRFFDRYLKGIENGWESEPPVSLFTMHGNWQQHPSWPPPNVESVAYYLGEYRLSASPLPEQSVEVHVDTLHTSGYGKRDLNRWTMASGTPRKPMERAKMARHATTFNSGVLDEDMEIIGNPIVELWVSSAEKNADVFVYLEEVDRRGKSWYITEGQLRASWHREGELAAQLGVSYQPQPDLPWHGFTPEYENREVFAGDEPVLLRFDLMPVGWKLRKGSRIRINVAGLDYGNFEINPAYFRDGKLRSDVQFKLHQGEDTPSRLWLPVVR